MDISKFLGKVIGSYLIIITLAMLMNMHQFMSHVNNLFNDTPLLFVTGLFTLFLGLLLVVSHNIWQWDWRVLITLFSWIALLKGAIIILCPHYIERSALSYMYHMNIAYIVASIDLVLGILLCYFGFSR